MSQVVNRIEQARPADGESTAELVQHASEQITRLVREEVALARLELAEKSRHAGMGAGLLGGGGLLALYGLGVLVIVAVLALAEALPAWLAALIVAVALFLVAGAMALIGRRQVRQAVPPMPQETADSVRADLGTVTAAFRDRGAPAEEPAASGRPGPEPEPRVAAAARSNGGPRTGSDAGPRSGSNGGPRSGAEARPRPSRAGAAREPGGGAAQAGGVP